MCLTAKGRKGGIAGSMPSYFSKIPSQVMSKPSQVESVASQVMSKPSQVKSEVSQVMSKPSQVESEASQVMSEASQVKEVLSQVESVQLRPKLVRFRKVVSLLILLAFRTNVIVILSEQ